MAPFLSNIRCLQLSFQFHLHVCPSSSFSYSKIFFHTQIIPIIPTDSPAHRNWQWCSRWFHQSNECVFDEDEWRQATLPVKLGGTGIRMANFNALPACLSSSRIATASFFWKLFSPQWGWRLAVLSWNWWRKGVMLMQTVSCLLHKPVQYKVLGTLQWRTCQSYFHLLTKSC